MSNNTAKLEAKKDTFKYRERMKSIEIHPLKYYEQMILDINMDGTENDDHTELFLEEKELQRQILLNSLRR